MMHASVDTEGARPLDFACASCRTVLPVAFTMAFQPIVDVVAGRVFAYEALVRGQEGQSAGDILARIEWRRTTGNRVTPSFRRGRSARCHSRARHYGMTRCQCRITGLSSAPIQNGIR